MDEYSGYEVNAVLQSYTFYLILSSLGHTFVSLLALILSHWSQEASCLHRQHSKPPGRNGDSYFP